MDYTSIIIINLGITVLVFGAVFCYLVCAISDLRLDFRSYKTSTDCRITLQNEDNDRLRDRLRRREEDFALLLSYLSLEIKEPLLEERKIIKVSRVHNNLKLKKGRK